MTPGDLARLLTGLAAEYRVPGAQLAVDHAGTSAAVAVGEPVDAAFPLGSLTKPFTAALAMTLVRDGDVELDAPLAAYLPEFGAGRDVTLRQLLSHTGGMAADVARDVPPAAGPRRWVARHGRLEDLAFPAGTEFSYSNGGYVVVGRLIEAVTGMTWRQALESVLLRPVGIDAAYVVGPPTRRRVVAGHAVSAGGGDAVAVHEQDLPELEAPNGALALSAADLAAFARLFLPGARGPLDEETAALMCTDQLGGLDRGPYGLADGWGLGWARYGPAGYGHDGTGDGTSCHLRFDPAGGTVVALTTNASTGPALWAALLPRLRAAGIPVADRDDAAPPGPAPTGADLEECLGSYRNGDARFQVERSAAGTARLALGGRLTHDLTLYADLSFVLREPGAQQGHAGRFLRDGDGRIEYLQLTGRLARRIR